MADEKKLTYKVRISKAFFGLTSPGTQLSNMRHTRGGVTLSHPDNVETTVELTKDQVEAIENDPAFEIKRVSASAATSPSEAKGGNSDAQKAADSAPKTPQTSNTPPAQTDGDEAKGGESEQSGEGAAKADEQKQGEADSEPMTAKQLKQNYNRDQLVEMAQKAGVEVAEGEEKGKIAEKLVAARQAKPAQTDGDEAKDQK